MTEVQPYTNLTGFTDTGTNQTIYLTPGPEYATQAALDELEANCVAEFKDIGARLVSINTQALAEELAALRSDIAKLRFELTGD